MFRVLCCNRFGSYQRLPLFVLTFTYVLLVLISFKLVIEPIQISYLNLEERKPLSTCSLTADRRGPHQKVIAYSIYGDFSQKEVVNRYLKPLRETIKTIPSIYPGSPNFEIKKRVRKSHSETCRLDHKNLSQSNP